MIRERLVVEECENRRHQRKEIWTTVRSSRRFFTSPEHGGEPAGKNRQPLQKNVVALAQHRRPANVVRSTEQVKLMNSFAENFSVHIVSKSLISRHLFSSSLKIKQFSSNSPICCLCSMTPHWSVVPVDKTSVWTRRLRPLCGRKCLMQRSAKHNRQRRRCWL